MTTIKYFAWLRERLNRGEEQVDLPGSVATVADLLAWLARTDPAAELALANPKIIRAAIDSQIVGHEASIRGARVISLFPPMTGG